MDDDDSDRSSEATQFEILTRDRHLQNDDDDDDDDVEQHFSTVNEYDFDDDYLSDDDYVTDDDDDQQHVTQLQTSHMEIDSSFQSETLGSRLAEVPIQYEVRQDELDYLKDQLQGSHQEALAIVIAQAAQAHTGNNKVQLPGVPSSYSEFSPPISSHPINSQEETPSTEGTPGNIRERNRRITSDPKTVTSSRTVKTPIDGYNWRKYGQKQVKSPQGSRSYFKCTYNECDAKKIESCDQYNSITKIVYRGQHGHDPPKKVFTKRGKKERRSRQNKSSGAVTNGPILVEEMDAPPPKRRVVKKSGSALPSSVLKRPKKPKFVIHAASDVGISADGYRWRKYGQKSVKGNPHPRGYYKCTSAGCPVRKHIEMAVDGSAEVILTYKGIHDHDMPVRAKDQGPPSVLLLNAVSSPSKSISQSKKSETDPSSNVVAEKKSSLEVH